MCFFSSGCCFFFSVYLITVTSYSFHCVYPAWGLLRFSNLWVNIFDQSLKYLGWFFLAWILIFWEFKCICARLCLTVPQNTTALVFSTIVFCFLILFWLVFFSLSVALPPPWFFFSFVVPNLLVSLSSDFFFKYQMLYLSEQELPFGSSLECPFLFAESPPLFIRVYISWLVG